MKTKGFTLVELLVVIAILAILATVSVVGYTSFIDNAKDSNAETELNTVKRQIDAEAMTLGYNFTVDSVAYTLKLSDGGYKFYNGTTEVTGDANVQAAVVALAAHLDAHSEFGSAKLGTWAASTDKKSITFSSKTTTDGNATWVIVK